MPISSDNATIERETKIPKVDFEQLSEELSGFGKFQIIVYLLGCLAVAISASNAVNIVFLTYATRHRCFVPTCDNVNSTYEEPFLNFTTPYNTNDSSFENCVLYDHFNSVECLAKDFDHNNTINCTQWVYESNVFTSTLITDFNLVCGREWLIPLGGTAFMLGMLIGASGIGILSDQYGRKTALLVSILIFALTGVISGCTTNYVIFLVLRILTGASGMGLYQSVFVIAVELIGSKWRTFCGMILGVPFALGESITALLAYFIRDWRYLQIACTASAFLLLPYYWIMPESVRWLVSKNRINDAVKEIERAAKVNNVPAPIHLLQKKQLEVSVIEQNDSKVESPVQKKKTMLNLFQSPNTRKRSLILFYCWAVCTLVYYGLSSNTGNLAGDIFVNFVLTMLIEIPSYFIAYFLLDRIGRKGTIAALLFTGGFSCVTSSLLPDHLVTLIVFLALMGKFGIAAAFGCLFVYTAELFPTEFRSIGIGACSTCGRIGGLFAPVIANLANIYNPLPLLIFGALSLIATCLIICLPETYGSDLPQTLEESENFGSDQTILYFTCFKNTKKGIAGGRLWLQGRHEN